MQIDGTSRPLLITLTIFLGILAFTSLVGAADLTDKQLLGKHLFFDTNLSSPSGQSCASCHDPNFGFADPDTSFPTSEGIIPNRFGSRNAPTVTYLATAPEFKRNETTGAFSGGQFWDGRAFDLIDQAKGPFVNPIEMHSPNKLLVIQNIRKADYAPLFKQVYGNVLNNNNIDVAYNNMAEAIAEFEKSPELNKINSKFDYYLDGEVELTDQELQGKELFSGKANCFRCHTIASQPDGGHPVFTSFGFANIGVPANPNNLFYSLIRDLNPDGANFVDLGLGGFLKSRGDPFDVYNPQLGKMGFPTVRNIAKTAPYFHNGVFADLKTVVHFFNTRDVLDENGKRIWPPFEAVPEPPAPSNVSQAVGNIGLTDAEEDAIVAFMETLTDDYEP